MFFTILRIPKTMIFIIPLAVFFAPTAIICNNMPPIFTIPESFFGNSHRENLSQKIYQWQGVKR